MICISVTPVSRTFAKVDLLNAQGQCDLIELCLDKLVKEPDVKDMLDGISKPVLVSCRRKEDGGSFDGTDEQRMMLLRQAILAGPAYIELDYATAQSIPRFGKTKRVISYTSLNKPFGPAEIDEIFTEAKQINGDIVKFTWPTPTLEAAWPLLAAVAKKHELPAVGLGLGPAGAAFSLLGRKYGSPWMYAALEKGMEAYDGQLTVSELDDIYSWREIDSHTAFIGVVGLGMSEVITCRCFNAMFKKAQLNVRSLPLMSQKFDKLKSMIDSLKINAIVTSRALGDEMLSLADEQEESAKLGQYADLLLRKSGVWQAYNSIWRSAVRMLERTIGGEGAEKRPLDKQNVLIVGSGSLAKSMIHGISKRKGLVSITSPNDKQAQEVAGQFQVRYVPFQNLYNTLSDVVIIADTELKIGTSKTEFNPSYFMPRHVVCDVTEMPNDGPFLAQARERGARVVEPKDIYLDQLTAFLKSITGKEVPASEFEGIVADGLARAQPVEE